MSRSACRAATARYGLDARVGSGCGFICLFIYRLLTGRRGGLRRFGVGLQGDVGLDNALCMTGVSDGDRPVGGLDAVDRALPAGAVRWPRIGAGVPGDRDAQPVAVCLNAYVAWLIRWGDLDAE